MRIGFSVFLRVALVLIILFLAPTVNGAETKVDDERAKTAQPSAAPPSAKDAVKHPWDRKPSVTTHSVTIKGKELRYTATAGYLPLTDEAGKPTAYVFFTAYDADTGQSRSRRPVTFAFNGGPGASSLWLHMAVLGPKRVNLSDDGKGLPPPYEWVANEETWLDATDLVFVDPVGTGYSRLAEGAKSEDFYGITKDVESLAQFIKLYCARYERWLSPKFLAGESYGTTRVAGLAHHLQTRAGMSVNGVVLISSVLNFQTIAPGPGNDIGYALLLPAYTMAAAYHHRLRPELQEDIARTREEVERFALTDYLVALARGYALTPAEREALIGKLARYTGLKPLTIRNGNLRIDQGTFARQLLEDTNLRVGLYDSRFTGHYRPGTFMEDPSMYDVTAPLIAACNDYLRRELKQENDLTYEFLSDKVNREWKWGSAREGYVDVAPALAAAMEQNRFLTVFVASGYHDLVTPYFATQYTFNRLGPMSDLTAPRNPSLLRRGPPALHGQNFPAEAESGCGNVYEESGLPRPGAGKRYTMKRASGSKAGSQIHVDIPISSFSMSAVCPSESRRRVSASALPVSILPIIFWFSAR